MFSIPIFVANERPRRPRSSRCPMSQPPYHHGSCNPGESIFSQLPPWMFAATGQRNPQSHQCCNGAGRRSEREEHTPEDFGPDFLHSLLADLFGEGERQDVPKEGNCSADNGTARPSNTGRPEARENCPMTEILKDVLQKCTDRPVNPQKRKPQKWQQVVDCADFNSDNISVKVLNGSVIIRAAKEESRSDGSACSTKLEKCIKLPKHVNAKAVSCRLLPGSKLLIEAPTMSQESRRRGQDSQCQYQGTGNTQSKMCKEEQPRIEMKVLPNGALAFGLVSAQTPEKSDNSNKGKSNKNTDTPTTKSKEGASKKVNFKQTPEDKGDVKSVEVEQSKTSSASKKDIIKVSSADETQQSQTVRADPSDVTEQEQAQISEDSSEQTSVMTPFSSPTETRENTEKEVPYTVELPNGDDNDDASSQTSHDSESSFVLLSTEPEMVSGETASDGVENTPNTSSHGQTEDRESDDMDNIGAIVQSVVDTLANGFGDGEQSQKNAKPHEIIGNIMQYVAQKAPEDLKKFVVDKEGPLSDALAKLSSRGQETMSEVSSKERTKTQEKKSDEDQPQVADEKQSSATDSEEEFQIRLEMPCFGPDSIRVTMDDDQRVLNIRANKEGDSSESVHKIISVPDSVSVKQLRCHFQDGRLSITAPYMKREKDKTREIPINA